MSTLHTYQITEAVKLYSDGLSLKEVGRKLGASPMGVLTCFRKHNIPTRAVGPHSDATRQRIRESWARRKAAGLKLGQAIFAYKRAHGKFPSAAEKDKMRKAVGL